MKAQIHPTGLEGEIVIPASKSHTIRALLIASLASGESIVANPLDSQDARSCIETCRAFGAAIAEIPGGWNGYERALRVVGVGPRASVPDSANGSTTDTKQAGGILASAPANVIDVGNSGTTEYLAAGIAALGPGWTVFTGDDQIRNRPVENLLAALRDLGAEAFSTRGNGKAPFVVRGPIRDGNRGAV